MIELKDGRIEPFAADVLMNGRTDRFAEMRDDALVVELFDS